MTEVHPNLRAKTLAEQYYRLFDGYLRFGEDFWGRCWTIMSGNLRRATEQLERGSLGLRGSERVLPGLLDGYVNCVSEMAMALPLAAETASSRMARIPLMLREGGTARDRRMPGPAGRCTKCRATERTDGQDRLHLPVRFIDVTDHYYDKAPGSHAVGRSVEADLISGFDLGGWRERVAVPHEVPCFVTAEEQIAWGGINTVSRWDAHLVRVRARQDMRGKGLGLVCQFLDCLDL
jgi:hypothetical protein